MDCIITNTWTNASTRKPPIGREVLAKFADGHKAVSKWNGMYWLGQHGMRFMHTEEITRFYIYDLDREDDDQY